MKSSTAMAVIVALIIGAALGAAAAYFLDVPDAPSIGPKFVVLRPATPPLDTSVRWYDLDDHAYESNGHSIFDVDEDGTDWCRLPADMIAPKNRLELEGEESSKRTVNSNQYPIELKISDDPEIRAEITFHSSSSYIDWTFKKVVPDKGTVTCKPKFGDPDEMEGLPDELMNLTAQQISFLGGDWDTLRLVD